MFSALTSLLLLGTAPPHPPSLMLRTLPGIEVLKIGAPVLAEKIPAMPRSLSASGMLLVDVRSGQVLLQKHPDQKRPMASLTKIMTALLILERHKLSDIASVPKIVADVRGSTIGVKTGELFSIEDLLKALLIPSANDAAYALAITDAGSVAGFVERMNLRARSLGLKNTHFTNPAGLDSEDQYSTARDLSRLTITALKNSDFRRIVRTKSAMIATNSGAQFDLRNTNELLGKDHHVFGVKTGTTSGAGECLIVLFEEKKREYLLVLLGSNNRYTDSLSVLEAVRDALSS